jgi:uncharacterized RDD family membrane protein YckC
MNDTLPEPEANRAKKAFSPQAAQKDPDARPQVPMEPERTGGVREDSGGAENAADGLFQQPTRPAPLFRRLAAFLIDLSLINLLGVLLVMAAFGGMAVALRQSGQPLPSRDLVFSLAEYGASAWPLLIVGYFGYVTAQGGQTVGKRMLKIRVVTTRGTAVGPLQAWWRAVVVCASLPVFAVYLLAALTPHKRALHDYLAGTRVIRQPDPLKPPIEVGTVAHTALSLYKHPCS